VKRVACPSARRASFGDGGVGRERFREQTADARGCVEIGMLSAAANRKANEIKPNRIAYAIEIVMKKSRNRESIMSREK
jgi:hypothetical protein